MKILVAEDDLETRELLAITLRRWGYEVLLARDGVEAFAILEQEAVYLLVCDWMMPRMDGLELCRKIRVSWEDRYLYIVLLTGRDTQEDVLAGMDAGADDYLTKPINFTALRIRVRAAERLLVFERRLAQKNQELTQSNNALHEALATLQENLQAAARLQAQLLPSTIPQAPSLDLCWLFLPATTVGGDVFNFIQLNERYLIFYHIDVAGHGVPAAMMALNISDHLSREKGVGRRTGDFASRDPGGQLQVNPPEVVVNDLNRRFMSDENRSYFTMIYGFLDLQTGDGRFCQAGHPYPLIWRKNGGVERVGFGGFPVGILPDVGFDSVPFHLAQGDTLVLYSDGITECSNPEGEHYGLERVSALLTAQTQQPFQDLPAQLQLALEGWRDRGGFEDDISMMALRHC